MKKQNLIHLIENNFKPDASDIAGAMIGVAILGILFTLFVMFG